MMCELKQLLRLVATVFLAKQGKRPSAIILYLQNNKVLPTNMCGRTLLN